MLSVFPLIDVFAPLPSAAEESAVHADSLTRLNALPNRDAGKEHARVGLLPPHVIALRHVSFRYEGTERDVLRDLSLHVMPGEKLAILGASGAGKSTLAALIRGDLRPDRGEAFLSGVPTASLGDSVTRYIGVVQQKPYLFRTSLYNNLRIGRPGATRMEAWAALAKVGLSDMALRLPEGLDAEVDEAGLRFSGGERQRLALARVLLTEAPIILLDEPTVGLDPVTEEALLETFFEALEGKTLLWITHHLMGAERMDRVVFLENGRLAMDGAPEELARTNERYRRLRALE